MIAITREEILTDVTSKKILPPAAVVTEEEEQISAENPQAELIGWYYCLGHCSFKKLRLLSALGILTRLLMTAKPSKCAGSLYGAMPRRPWRTKSPNNGGKLQQVMAPGDCIYVDQLYAYTPSLISQVKGRPTKQCYHAATIFTDHYSGLSYVHLQKSLTSEVTVKAKRAFEAYSQNVGFKIRHDHSENGRLQDNSFM